MFDGCNYIGDKARRDELGSIMGDIVNAPTVATDINVLCKLTDEAAIEHLQASGWMQRHDRAMSFDSLTAVINGLMQDGNKTISVNVYPWKEDGDD